MQGAAHFEKEPTRFDLIEANERFLGRLHLHHGGKPLVELRESEPKVVLIPTRQAIDLVFHAPPKAKAIVFSTAEYYGIPWLDLVSARRTGDLIKPRFVAIWLLRDLTPWSMPKIAKYFGRRDHTSILHAIRRVDEMLKTDPRVADDIDVIRLKIYERYMGAAE